jgi:uncharacterized membrane protein YdfJ with MMPL/SSD domain
MVLIIVLVLVGWIVASVVVAVLASTVFRGARSERDTITLPPDHIDLTSPAARNRVRSTERPGQDSSR